MTNIPRFREIFPFSVELDDALLVVGLGRTLHRVLGDRCGERFTDVFELSRQKVALDPETIVAQLGRPILLEEEGSGLTLMGEFARLDEGYMFLGGPRVEHLQDLDALGLSIGDFSAHDGVMHNLFLLQRMDVSAAQALEATRDLVAQERRYRQIVDQSNDIIFSIRRDGVITFANPAAGELLDVDPGGSCVEDLLLDESRVSWREAASALLGGKSSARVELALAGRGGTPVLVEGHFVLNELDQGEEGIVGFLRDVTEQAQVRRDLEQSTEQLRQAQKMEAIGRFAGGIAHDFNNLLSVIIGSGSLLREDLPLADPRRENLDMILASADKGAALARQLLLFSRRKLRSDARTDLVKQTRELLQILTRVVSAQIELVFEPAEGSVEAAIEPGQYEQVLMNLVVNARDAMSGGGAIHISVSRSEGSEVACVRVSDSGVGMAPDVVQRIFEPFYTTKAADQGTGLGLSVVYGIISGAGGEIDVESSPGYGTTFTVRLPVVESAADSSAPEKVAAPIAPMFAGEGCVALVEDRPDLRRVTARSLESFGFEVVAFEGVEDARAGLADADPFPVLLVTDVKLADGNGLDLAEEIVDGGRLDKVIVITGHSSQDRIDALILKHGWRLLMKPFSPRQLGTLVQQVMEAD